MFTVYTVHYIDIVCIKLNTEHYVAASQANLKTKRGFSVCGTLTTGRRNKMIKSLEVRACLYYLNRMAVDIIGCLYISTVYIHCRV